MNRRSFLTRLASGIVGVALVDVEWIPTPSTLTIPESAALTDMDTITAEYLRRLVNQLNQPWRPFTGRFIPGAYRLGEHGLIEQLGIDMQVSKLEIERGLNPDAYLEPAAYQMAQAINKKHLKAFGALPVNLHMPDLEAAVATDEATGVAVRGLRFFDIDFEYGHPHWKMRFDVLGAA